MHHVFLFKRILLIKKYKPYFNNLIIIIVINSGHHGSILSEYFNLYRDCFNCLFIAQTITQHARPVIILYD